MNIQHYTKPDEKKAGIAEYRVEFSDEVEDKEWDAFLAEIPGGHQFDMQHQ